MVCDKIEAKTGQRPKAYKKMEMDRLIKIFNSLERKQMDGFHFMSYVLSTLIVEQALPNTNHRTTLTFIGIWFDTQGYNFKFELERHNRRMTKYILDSKVLIENRGTDKKYRAKHLEISEQFMEEFLGRVQSGRLGRISSISLITSFTDSARDLDFFSTID